MSANFEKKLFMPSGPLGPTTALGPHEKQIIRWYRKEWSQFLGEMRDYKRRVLEQYRTLLLRVQERRARCPHCQKTYDAVAELMAFMRRFGMPKYQRGSILMASAGYAAAAGSSGCTATASAVPNLTDSTVSPDVASTAARLHSDGDWYYTTTFAVWGSSKGTWQGSCAVADYETRWVKVSGDPPNSVVSGTDSVWSAATTSKACGYQTAFGPLSGSFELECRDGDTDVELFSDSFTMDADAD